MFANEHNGGGGANDDTKDIDEYLEDVKNRTTAMK
jgi:hypothetical protein